jgi:hypothetical protein
MNAPALSRWKISAVMISRIGAPFHPIGKGQVAPDLAFNSELESMVWK